MTTLPANPLQALLATAGKTLPASTGATAGYRARYEGATDRIVLLADVSGSMAQPVPGRGRRVDVLQSALDVVLTTLPQALLIGFANIPEPCAALPTPGGGTALHLALDRAGAERPRQIILLTDGEPDDEAAAFAAADRTTGTIDVIYCGDDGNAAAIAFCRALARRGCGRYGHRDLRAGPAQLTHDIKLLAAPR